MPLVAWYRGVRRPLPWREDRDPYKVWISEIMLQQTRIEAVKPYFARFMAELPSIDKLARVEEERLLKLWEGLGYYSRARNLKKCALAVMEDYQGSLPADFEKLKKLPGIGPYTAGAIASIAYGLPVPAVDGNVLRVVSRLCECEEDILQQSVRREWEKILTESMPMECPGEFNEALMELGETVCIPNGLPDCAQCPIARECQAYAHGRQQDLPVKTPKKPRRIEPRTVFLLTLGEGRDMQIAIRKRGDKGLLSGLYEFPSMQGHLSIEEAADFCRRHSLPTLTVRQTENARHIFSHVEWDMRGYIIRLDETRFLRSDRSETVESRWDSQEDGGSSLIFAGRDALAREYALPTAFRVYRKVAEELWNPSRELPFL